MAVLRTSEKRKKNAPNEMQMVHFFHRQLPVIEDAPIRQFDDGPHKVWQLVIADPTGGSNYRLIPMREKIGVVTLRERFDYWLWHENKEGSLTAYASHFEPASENLIRYWLSAHHKRKAL